MRLRLDLERIGKDRRARVRRGSQPEGLWTQNDRAIVAVRGPVGQGYMERHWPALPILSYGQEESKQSSRQRSQLSWHRICLIWMIFWADKLSVGIFDWAGI